MNKLIYYCCGSNNFVKLHNSDSNIFCNKKNFLKSKFKNSYVGTGSSTITPLKYFGFYLPRVEAVGGGILEKKMLATLGGVIHHDDGKRYESRGM